MSPEWITAGCAALALVGGGFWASFTYFASKEQTAALHEAIVALRRDQSELRDLVNAAHSNHAYYKLHIEEQKTFIDKAAVVMENVDGLFRTLDSKLKNIPGATGQ